MSRFFPLLWAVLVSQVLPAQPATPVILISVDTLRADHLSAYQPSKRPTPHVDSLAKNGTLFGQVNSPYPLTLPAHTALLSSTYPFANGVEDNGIPLKSGVPTLATVLKSAGYKTGAFVASFVLDRRFGLNRGFEVYDGPLDLHNKDSVQVERKRPGPQVTEAALRWVDQNASGPFFLFLHLYDLHQPYDPAQPSYAAEVSYEDKVIGDFLAALESRKILQKALVVFTSDHGEGLGDHGESTHGYFVYQSTLHVPLIIHWPAGFKRSPKDRVDEPASLLDVAPTILDVVGVKPPAGMRGRSLIGPAGEREVYSGSIYARNHFGCSPIGSIRLGRYKYIQAPKPELYDLSTDPKEQRNLYPQQQATAKPLSDKLAAIRASAPAGKAGSPKPDTTEKLRSLGYLSGSAKSGSDPHIDPKDRIGDFERYYTALTMASSGRLPEAGNIFQTLSAKLPDVVDIRIALGQNRQRQGDMAGAAREFKRAIEQAPSDAQPHFELGSCDFRLGQLDDAVRELKATLSIEPWYARADEALAEIYVQKKDLPQARAHLTHLLSIDPDSYAGHYNLGIFAAMQQNWPEAEQHMLSALRADPGSAEAHETLGKIYFQRHDLDRARQQFEETVRLAPRLAVAHYDLAMVLQQQGKMDQAAQEMRAAQQLSAPRN